MRTKFMHFAEIEPHNQAEIPCSSRRIFTKARETSERDEELMVNQNLPHVSVGLPVYNGEQYVRQAIESILSQTFQDFELIISDNASTDATECICREYAAKDSRIRYYRNDRNRGAAWNNNRVVELARGEFFKWQAHDDYCDSTFLEKCLAVLHSNPNVVLCYPQFVRVDEQGKRLAIKSSRVAGGGEPLERFRSMIYRRDSCEEVFGVSRTVVIRKTGLIGPYSYSDDTFLAELILHGQFYQIPEPLFFYRIHPGQSTRSYPNRSALMTWFNPSASRFSLPFLRLFRGYLSLVWRSPVPRRVKLRCYSSMAGWFWFFRDWLTEDLRLVRSFLTDECLAPWFKQHAPWTGPVWHWIKDVKKRLARPESAAARARRLCREQLESGWKMED
jgi:glycosyltransferase involved in cell wall biosynthesis